MKRVFLKRGDSSRLKVFFGGWGMDERAFAHLAGETRSGTCFRSNAVGDGRGDRPKNEPDPDPDRASLAEDGADDFLLCYDYTVPENRPEFEGILASYDRVSLAAFSLGVWAAAETLAASRFSFDEAVAINGTLRPIDPDFGIPPERFERTAEQWSETTRTRFYRRMCGDAKTLGLFLARAPARSVESQREELFAVGRRIAGGIAETTIFRRAFVGLYDRIFPPESQRRFWESQGVEIVESPVPHYPFAEVKSVDELCP
jgi:pimeloyl-[acyl-carrier protein] methyl ester esterase